MAKMVVINQKYPLKYNPHYTNLKHWPVLPLFLYYAYVLWYCYKHKHAECLSHSLVQSSHVSINFFLLNMHEKPLPKKSQKFELLQGFAYFVG